MRFSSIRPVLAVFALAVVPILILGCAGDAEEATDVATLDASPTQPLSSPAGVPSEGLLVAVVKDLPVFPASDAKDSGGYSTTGYYAGALSTSFNVTPGTSVADISAFFSDELPAAGWREEKSLQTISAAKEGTRSEMVIGSWVKDGLRLVMQIPITHKDAPDGVASVQLFLAQESNNFMSTPVATPIDATPLPTEPAPTTTVTFEPSTSPAPASPDPTALGASTTSN